jgi:hypothetical protein
MGLTNLCAPINAQNKVSHPWTIICLITTNARTHKSKELQMNKGYFLDASKFSLDRFQSILKSKNILPGRIILKDQIDERFELLRAKGLKSLSDLLDALKTKARIDLFSKDSGLSAEYLTILRREANSYISTPVRLSDMPFAEIEVIERLEAMGIKDSKQLYEFAYDSNDRVSISSNIGVSSDKILELFQLCDLVRITGVGPVFVRIIYDSGIHSVLDFLSVDSNELFDRLSKTNNESGFTKARFTQKDIEYCIELGKELPISKDK